MPQNEAQAGIDFKAGVDLGNLAPDKPVLGHVGDEPIILVRHGEEFFATGAVCTHYGGPLAEGLVVGGTIRCPWHHARFDLRSGEAIGGPALNPVSCFHVTREGGMVTIGEKKTPDFRVACPLSPSSVVIVGAGAAGAACVEKLRAKGYQGPITLVGDEEPVDRPNLSKDYLAGSAPEEWIPLRNREFYESIRVELIIGDPAVRIDPPQRQVFLRSGRALEYGRLLLATGAEPRSLNIEGANLPHVFRLRTLADSRAIIAKAGEAKSCAVIGSSFIGLDVAASLRQRGLEVAIIGHESIPLKKILGDELGRFVQKIHEEHGVRFFLNTSPRAIRDKWVELANGESVEGGLVVLGVGVSPRISLADAASLTTNNGIVVDEALRTSAPDIFVAGDVARYPEPISRESARIEHWVVAERQGQSVARSMLGIGGPFRDTPFFWSQHYDVTICYVGHASSWDTCEIKGDLAKRDACAVYRRNSRVIAAATVGRDSVSLKLESALEAGDPASVEAILRNQ